MERIFVDKPSTRAVAANEPTNAAPTTCQDASAPPAPMTQIVTAASAHLAPAEMPRM